MAEHYHALGAAAIRARPTVHELPQGRICPPPPRFNALISLQTGCGTPLATKSGMKTITLSETFLSNPIANIGPAAQRLLDDLGGAEAGDGRVRVLLERALAVAAAAEDRIAEQNRRIAFLEGLSRTDELTGLMNRRGFIDELKRALARARRSGESGVVIFCDVDDFKSVNDRFGHAGGDEVLRIIARTITASVREIDMVARIGGDEFAVLLADTSRRDGAKRARMLQRELDRCVYRLAGERFQVGVSLGIEPYGPHDEAKDVLARADMDMYCNKRRKAANTLRVAVAAE
jgi:diguanylate cyclase (GGDEF)-like protein